MRSADDISKCSALCLHAATSIPPSACSTAAATASKDTLTLTGWAALAGVFALATVVLALVVYGVRRGLGLGGNASRRGYTMVVKQELAAELAHQGSSQGGASMAHGPTLPRRHG